jgi:thioredoxin reductase (NADPH)
LPSSVAATPRGRLLFPQPLVQETSRPGVFAVGDVRSGSVKRVAGAIGEGSAAVRLAFERLQAEGTADPIGLTGR